jgi:2-dehydro-3-deoxyphosphogluconate aldolase/(4S)-4-hydroxy-2-oxoglutarate aldolase
MTDMLSGSGTLAAVCARRVVPVVVVDELAIVEPLADALVAAGLPVAEVTFRTRAAVEAIATLADRGDVLVGAGTVVRPDQVDLAVEAGAQFIVSPGLSARVVARCQERSVPVIPGVATPSEVMAAIELGIDLLKLFPAGALGGVAMVQALAGPFPDVRWVPTGGIGSANAADYLALPTVAAIGGSWMVARPLLAARDFDAVTRLAREAVASAAAATS